MFVYTASAVILLLALPVGYGLGKLLGYNRLVLSILIVGVLVPWFGHHTYILTNMGLSITQALQSKSEHVFSIAVTGPALVFSLVCLGIYITKKLKFATVIIPASAFLITWYLTFRELHATEPDIYIDNVANVWLFIYSVGGTALLFGYLWHSISKDLPNNKKIKTDLRSRISKFSSIPRC